MFMKKMLVMMAIASAASFMVSCIELNGSGYSSLTEQERLHVKECAVSLDSITNDGNLYAVKVDQVKDYLQDRHGVLVYEYLPFCSGESGRNPAEIQQYCVKNQLDLVVISSVYDRVLPISLNLKFPVFVVDRTPYGTDNYRKYSEKFYSALTNDNSKMRKTSSYHFFIDGKYVKSRSSLRGE